jgi:hypothetical protein
MAVPRVSPAGPAGPWALRPVRVLDRVHLPLPWHWERLEEEPDFALWGPPPGAGSGGSLRAVWIPGGAAGADAGAHAAAAEALAQAVRGVVGPGAAVERLPDGGAFGVRDPDGGPGRRFWARSLAGGRGGAGILAAALEGADAALADAVGLALRSARG